MSNDTAIESRNLFDVLKERGLFAQTTDENIRDILAKPVTAYSGFDPTADSLHIGSLVPIMGLAHMQRCGHRPLVLVGGATGLVGDPSGKTETRKMLTIDEVNHNANCIAKQIGRVVRFDDSPTGAKLVNNADWIKNLTWIDLLREVGSRVSVNRMLSMESVKGRMSGEGDGITYLEFSYMIMQAYDFAYLNQKEGCTIQIAGQDQWGNIVMGIELGRKMHDASLFGLTFPLITKSDGGKFGKSEAGNVWLDANRTSPFEFYQFWRNVADADLKRFFGFFTFLPMDEINQLTDCEGAALNPAKERLAYEVTKLIHGEDEATAAQESAQKAFSAAADVTGDSIPNSDLPNSELDNGLDVRDLLCKAGFTKSKGEAKKLIINGGVRLHDEKISDFLMKVTDEHVKDGYILLRAGKKRMHRFDISN
ncbi:Tyrosine--tRNA ligase [Poriferisphaera corsica]|uniref:Tyrosine--tRNA ligase n=1 Tax=Poriferisphaera corsica TaxID=2528020 RepID=A0A517YRQ5_9BACT|nr:tyrosine--tRNA ligase [Poriferisphaera corsica]QDU32906.1 Tyrosine--tRNA ligase [Poriferisphaera corsica]